MKGSLFTDKTLLLGYFIIIILTGSLLLSLPISWEGSEPLGYLDALFTATSAACVTGLITVDTASYSIFGQTVILLLIQMGGLGILTFSTLFLLMPGNRFSFHNRKLIKEYYVESLEYEPATILKKILLLTFSIEAIGMLLLFTQFRTLEKSFFSALFHAVSAFCNAGFSTFSDSLEGWNRNPVVLSVIIGLIIAGGLSFTVITDTFARAVGRRRKISFHSKIVLIMTFSLITLGTLFFFILERNHAFQNMSAPQAALNSMFLSVTPRTAGFNTVSTAGLHLNSKTLVTLLMYIGGAPGSTAGGIKVTTFFLIILIVLKGVDGKGEIRIAGKKIGAKTLSHANMFMLKALFLVSAAIIALSITEGTLVAGGKACYMDIIFETVSAFGTVGLSLGITPLLSNAGKIVIICTMFAGRVGLVFMAIPFPGKRLDHLVDYPHGEVLIG
ncbi:MAG: potassium transporter [Spirochaetales bacterium]|nr:potassium transporter [Spirochaetales bacterium]